VHIREFLLSSDTSICRHKCMRERLVDLFFCVCYMVTLSSAIRYSLHDSSLACLTRAHLKTTLSSRFPVRWTNPTRAQKLDSRPSQ
jgi:hypothetical protein